jgi:hypothetical protein
MIKRSYTPGGDAKAIAEIANTHFGDFTKMFEYQGWPECGQFMMRKMQTRVKETYGRVKAFEACFRKKEGGAMGQPCD